MSSQTVRGRIRSRAATSSTVINRVICFSLHATARGDIFDRMAHTVKVRGRVHQGKRPSRQVLGGRGRAQRLATLVRPFEPPTRTALYGIVGKRPRGGLLGGLQILVDRIEDEAAEDARDPAANVLEAAHRYGDVRRVLVQLLRPQLMRVKRCPTCEQWFVDTTRNRSMARCGGGARRDSGAGPGAGRPVTSSSRRAWRGVRGLGRPRFDAKYERPSPSAPHRRHGKDSEVTNPEPPVFALAFELCGTGWPGVSCQGQNRVVDTLEDLAIGRAFRKRCEVSTRRSGERDPIRRRPCGHLLQPEIPPHLVVRDSLF